jgi:glutamate-ammonia-ligase adenylyltransferase
MKVSDYLTWLAEAILEEVLALAWRHTVARHGQPRRADGSLCDPAFIILGYGKVGGIELGHGSDLDLVFIHDGDPNAETDGAKPIDGAQFFTRLGQRIIHLLTTQTTSGQLYEVDMRLRPSGVSGLLVSSLNAFSRYQSEEAWTWEHLALTRARVAIGDEGLAETVDSEIARIMALPRDRAKIVGDVLDMRALMARERPPRHPFDLKLHDGGLVDLEFVAQTAQLLEGTKLDVPQAPPAKVLLRLTETGILPQGERLAEIHATYATILQLMSACLLDPLKDEGWTPAFRELVARRANYPDFARLEADIVAMRAEVSAAAAQFYKNMRG